jgi:hypothetical protein
MKLLRNILILQRAVIVALGIAAIGFMQMSLQALSNGRR